MRWSGVRKSREKQMHQFEIEIALFSGGPWTLVERVQALRAIPVFSYARKWQKLGIFFLVRVVRDGNAGEATHLRPVYGTWP